MSLILDALRRAERGRTRDLGQRIGTALPPRARDDGRPLLAIVFVVVAAGAGAWVLVRTAPTAPERVTVTPPPRGSSLAEIAVPEPATTAIPPTATRAPLLEELPSGARTGLPNFTLDAHFWSPEPDRRFVMIGMARYREGERMPNGLHVVAILPEGVELAWRETTFRILAR